MCVECEKKGETYDYILLDAEAIQRGEPIEMADGTILSMPPFDPCHLAWLFS